MKFRRRTYRVAIQKKIVRLQEEQYTQRKHWEDFSAVRPTQEYKKTLHDLQRICDRGRAEGYRFLI